MTIGQTDAIGLSATVFVINITTVSRTNVSNFSPLHCGMRTFNDINSVEVAIFHGSYTIFTGNVTSIVRVLF